MKTPAKQPPTPIIALFARSREVGFVIVEHSKLSRYGVKTIKAARRGATFVKAVERTLDPLLETAHPNGLIVVEQNPNTPQKGMLCRTIYQMSQRWKQKGYPVRFLSLTDIKQYVCETPKATHHKLIETIAQRYPILLPLITSAKNEKALYWQKVLIAMAMADVANSRAN